MKVEMKRETFNEIIKMLNDESDRARSASLVTRAGQLNDMIKDMVEEEEEVPKKVKLMEKEE